MFTGGNAMESAMESPYQKDWRLQDVIAAIQVMGASAWVNMRIGDWAELLGLPRSAETWEAILKEHPEFFKVRTPPWISAANLNFSLLVTKLGTAHDPVSRYLKSKFSRRTQELLDSYDGSSTISDETKTALAKELNSVIRRQELYGKEPFADYQLPPDIVNLLKDLPPVDARMIRNRLVLEASYQKEMMKQDFEPIAALTWRSSYGKNYYADQWRELTVEEVQKLPFEERDRLSRRPLDAMQIQALVTTALELHAHMLKLRAEMRAVKQERRWWIPLAAGVLSFAGAILGAFLKG
jgi:hypothetical protein